MRHLHYVNFEMDNAKHSNKRWTIQTYFHYRNKYNVDHESTTINQVMEEYARNLPLKFVMAMYKANNLPVG